MGRRETTPTRTKAATLATLKRVLGKEEFGHQVATSLSSMGANVRARTPGLCGSGIDIGVIKMRLTHAAAVHGLKISVEGVDLARVALKRPGMIVKWIERDRRPTAAELSRLFRCFDENARLRMP